MFWEFMPASDIPDVPTRGIQHFIILERGLDGGMRVYVAYYLNCYPLEVEDCVCGGENDGDGCPHTGWYYDNSNFNYEHCYHEVRGEVVAYARIPDAETAYKLIKGPW